MQPQLTGASTATPGYLLHYRPLKCDRRCRRPLLGRYRSLDYTLRAKACRALPLAGRSGSSVNGYTTLRTFLALDAAATACEPTLALRQRHGHRSLVGGRCPPKDPAVLRAVEAEGGARRGTAAALVLAEVLTPGASGPGAPGASAGRRNATSARAPASMDARRRPSSEQPALRQQQRRRRRQQRQRRLVATDDAATVAPVAAATVASARAVAAAAELSASVARAAAVDAAAFANLGPGCGVREPPPFESWTTWEPPLTLAELVPELPELHAALQPELAAQGLHGGGERGQEERGVDAALPGLKAGSGDGGSGYGYAGPRSRSSEGRRLWEASAGAATGAATIAATDDAGTGQSTRSSSGGGGSSGGGWKDSGGFLDLTRPSAADLGARMKEAAVRTWGACPG